MNRVGLLLAIALGSSTGCHLFSHEDEVSRLQADDEAPRTTVRTVGEVGEFQAAAAIPVSGIGLVVGLDGTGGGTPPGNYRQMAEEYLKKNKITNPKEWLDSPNNALVLINGEIPAGSHEHDRINIEVTLPTGSKVKSLRGGYLLPTTLMSYATRSQVREFVEKTSDARPQDTGDGLLKGHVLADAEGPLQVNLKDKENDPAPNADVSEAGIKRAWIWKGGRTKTAQPYYLVLNSEQQRYRMAINVAEHINVTFHGPGAEEKIAAARNADTVVFTIPPQYRGNPHHFRLVVSNIPVDRIDPNGAYVRQQEERLYQPETTLSAALRLEALGRDSIKVLTDAMKKSPYPLVKFAAAQSLAYLGEPIAAMELAKLVENHPALQLYGLSALASLDEAASNMALEGLLASETPEVRYGAFRALRELDPRGKATQGEAMNKSFWLHAVAPQSTPFVHLLSYDRAEIVVFGDTPKLVAPFALRAGPDIIVSAKPGQTVCTISRFAPNKPDRVEQCSLAVADIVKTMADMGALYQDVAEMLLEAREIKALNCGLGLDALPKGVTLQKLADNAKVDKNMENEAELLRSASPESSLPNLFDHPRQ